MGSVFTAQGAPTQEREMECNSKRAISTGSAFRVMTIDTFQRWHISPLNYWSRPRQKDVKCWASYLTKDRPACDQREPWYLLNSMWRKEYLWISLSFSTTVDLSKCWRRVAMTLTRLAQSTRYNTPIPSQLSSTLTRTLKIFSAHHLLSTLNFQMSKSVIEECFRCLPSPITNLKNGAVSPLLMRSMLTPSAPNAQTLSGQWEPSNTEKFKCSLSKVINSMTDRNDSSRREPWFSGDPLIHSLCTAHPSSHYLIMSKS